MHVLILTLISFTFTHMPVIMPMIVIMIMPVIVIMPMIVIVPVIMIMPVIVPMTDIMEEDETHQVDHQPADGRAHHLVVADLGRLAEAFDGLRCDAETDKDEEHAVDKARENFHASIAHGETVVGWPLRHVGSDEPYDECAAVEQHVPSITDKTEAVVEKACA